MTTRGWTPWAKSNVAHVCLRSWNRSGGRPAALRIRRRRLSTFDESSGVPVSASVRSLVVPAVVAQVVAPPPPQPLPWRDWNRTYSLKAGRKVRVETLRPKAGLGGRFVAADATSISIEPACGLREAVPRESVQKVLAERERMQYARWSGWRRAQPRSACGGRDISLRISLRRRQASCGLRAAPASAS